MRLETNLERVQGENRKWVWKGYFKCDSERVLAPEEEDFPLYLMKLRWNKRDWR
jgi:hypothetical protein